MISATGVATVLAVAKYATLGNDSCNLSRDGFERQVARVIVLCVLCNSAFRVAKRYHM